MASSARSASDAFSLLEPRIQRWIWDEQWSELRDIQERAIRVIHESDADVVIAAATAHGKTEAAFLPIASRLAWEQADPQAGWGPVGAGRSGTLGAGMPPGSLIPSGRAGLPGGASTGGAPKGGVRVLAISPLKALINDQYRRLEQLFEYIDVPVHPWHGDVAASKKRKVIEQPSGVVLITPESLEALFVRRGSQVPGMFASLSHVLIDELHAFIGDERGRQLQSLLHRVELAARRRIPRIALSATLGDMSLACDFLRPGEGAKVETIISSDHAQEVRLQIRGYEQKPPLLSHEASRKAEAEGREVRLEDMVSGDTLDVARDLYRTLRGGRHIAFANRRGQVEEYANLLRSLSEADRVPLEFFPHHGSLSKTLREEAEDALKDETKPATVVATSTLELGIDVGAVESIAQIGTPPSVASMRQRLGRSGRRGSPAVLRVYVQERRIEANTPPQDQLRAELVHSIALVRLLAQRWYEPPTVGRLHLSTLVQQLLSLIAQHGGVRAEQAWKALCQSGPFREVDAAMFARLLRDLASHKLITQTHDGELVLDLSGERLVNHYDFYAAFATPEEYRLVSGSRTIGTLPIVNPLLPNMYLIFGGRRWRVVSVDGERKVVELARAGGGKAPSFGGEGALAHDRVREEVRRVYEEKSLPRFVDATGQKLLQEARDAYRRYGLSQRYFIEHGRGTLLFPWVGDRVVDTLVLLFNHEGIPAVDEGVAIQFESGESDVKDALRHLSSAGRMDARALAAAVENKEGEKHHRFLGPELLAADYASSHLDVEGAYRTLERVLAAPSPSSDT
jgi:ATP-dependent Lhr-like helicase